jgi:virginiamycin B lyase
LTETRWTITEWFPISIPAESIVAGPDGALWFASRDRNNNKIGRITTAGVVTEFPITGLSSAQSFVFTNIAAGPDGALWFGFARVSPAPHRMGIGRITTTGTISEFLLPVPSPSGSHIMYGITAGPDGALWFTEPQDNKIGRITTTGELTEFPLPPLPKPGVASYVGITMGPDGALWFANPFGNQNGEISRITTAGAVTEFPIPPAFTGVPGITAGPDGALWFTQSNGRKIGRITTAGAVTEFPIPPASHVGRGPFRIGHDAWGITMGPDGALWFTDTIANKIGRITTTGELSEFLLPAPNSLPSGITAGPDGALWFTGSDNSRGKIGRIEQIDQ